MAGANLPITILVLGGGVAMVWTGITDPDGGLVGTIGRVLRGEPAPEKSTQNSAATIAGAILTYNPPSAGTGSSGGTSTANASGATGVLGVAESELGVKYVWGGGNTKGPTGGGFDCSGLTQYAYYKGAGITIPRVAEAQRQKSTTISAGQAAPGDLVFFGIPAYHVGIVTGPGQMIHAPHTGTVVKTEAISDVTPGPTTYGRFGSQNIASI